MIEMIQHTTFYCAVAVVGACVLAGAAQAESSFGASPGNLSPPGASVATETRHPNGLIIDVPAGFAAKQVHDGFAVEPSGSRKLEVRDPVMAHVSLVTGSAPEARGFARKSLGGKEVRYRVERSDGGSGGEVYILTVFEPALAGLIRYAQAMQSKNGAPDFTLCWNLVGSTRYEAPRRE
jgi:Tse3 toxin immunity protein Tsi3